jgi:hypothetical protein
MLLEACLRVDKSKKLLLQPRTCIHKYPVKETQKGPSRMYVCLHEDRAVKQHTEGRKEQDQYNLSRLKQRSTACDSHRIMSALLGRFGLPYHG